MCTLAKAGVQLIFTPRRPYRLSVAVLWYILVRLWMELFVPQGLIQALFGLFDRHKLIRCNMRCFLEKHQLGAKTTKMATPPHITAV